VPLNSILSWIDFDRLTGKLDLSGPGPVIRKVSFAGAPPLTAMGHKIFALGRGRAIIPHAHNDMVSAHLILAGRFHVRTYHRHFARECPGGAELYLEPGMDRHLGPGDLITMSDDRDNVHWMVAESERAYTFDVPITNLDNGRQYVTPANAYSLIFVDPHAGIPDNGLLRTPILDLKTALARYGM
jgi:hypothetical protein